MTALGGCRHTDEARARGGRWWHAGVVLRQCSSESGSCSCHTHRRAVRNNNGSNGSRLAEGPATDGHGPSARLRRAPRFQLELLLKDFAHFVDSDVALLYQVEGPGQTPTVSCSWGLGGPPQHIARPVEGGVVGRALERPARRAALGPLDPMFDSSLIALSEPPLQFAVTANVRSASGAHGVLIAGFVTRPRGGARMLWSAESYAAVIALCLDDRGALAELVATGPVRRAHRLPHVRRDDSRA